MRRLTDLSTNKDLPILNNLLSDLERRVSKNTSGVTFVSNTMAATTLWDILTDVLSPVSPSASVLVPGFIAVAGASILDGVPINNDYTLTNTVAGGGGPVIFTGGTEVRGVNSTVRNIRLAADEPTFGWDFFGVNAAAVIDSANRYNIVGKMMGVRGEVFIQDNIGAHTHNWAFGLCGSLSQIGVNNTVTNAATILVSQPCGWSSGGAITNNSGIWIQNQAATGLTVASNAGIRIDGIDEAGRIKWNYMDVREFITYTGGGGVTPNPKLGFYQSGTRIGCFDDQALKVGAGDGITGNALELRYSGGVGSMFAYNRTGSAYLPVAIDGLTLALNGTSGFGIGLGAAASSSAKVIIAQGTTAKVPLLFVSGSLKTASIDGGMEWDGSNLYFTQGGARDVLNPLHTKGDIFTHDASFSSALSVGTNGYVLTADSTATNGIKWAASGGGWGLTGNALGATGKQLGSTDVYAWEIIGGNVVSATISGGGAFTVNNTLDVGGAVTAHAGVVVTGGISGGSLAITGGNITTDLDIGAANIGASSNVTGAVVSGSLVYGDAFWTTAGHGVVSFGPSAVTSITVANGLIIAIS